MREEQIINTIEQYHTLLEYTEKVINRLEALSPKLYTTSRGVEKIQFDKHLVWVTCDDTCRGCYDSYSFSFPISYLSMTDEQLLLEIEKTLISIEKNKAEIKERKEKEQRDYEREQYEKLKAKYENL